MNVKLRKNAGYDSLIEEFGEDFIYVGSGSSFITAFSVLRPVDSNQLFEIRDCAIDRIYEKPESDL